MQASYQHAGLSFNWAGFAPAGRLLLKFQGGIVYLISFQNQRCLVASEGTVEGFTKKYGVHLLVHYERFTDMYSAITREKRLKKWRRAWKIRRIEENNPRWDDLWQQILT